MNPPFLVDASVWLGAMDRDDPFHGESHELVERAGDGTSVLAALDLTLYEVANVAVVSWRSPTDARRLVQLVRAACSDLLERADEELLRDAAKVAARHGLTVYDGAYVAAARRRAWTLVSADLRDLVEPGLALSPKQAVRKG